MKKVLYLALSFSFIASSLEGGEGYVARLERFVGTPYGALNCSGYICAARRHELCSAKEMWSVCGGDLTVVQQVSDKLDIDYSKLQPGDVAAFHGVHVAAYLGDGVWLDSDPAHNGVGKIRVENTKPLDPWFVGEIRILRWR
jgi:cell wall-associated NlpC family hydrolase